MERVTFTTDDGVEIVAHWHPVTDAKRFAMLLHMRPATKESWAPWIDVLTEKGIACLAFDQRGHGESTMDGTIVLDELKEKEGSGKQLDLKAAWAWWEKHGATEENLILIGASIGANLAIRFAADHSGVPWVIALSPGLDFRGVATMDAIVRFAPNQRVILVGSDDDETSWDAIHKLHEANLPQTVLIAKHKIGHGTRMTDEEPALIQFILDHLA